VRFLLMENEELYLSDPNVPEASQSNSQKNKEVRWHLHLHNIDLKQFNNEKVANCFQTALTKNFSSEYDSRKFLMNCRLK